MIWCALKKFPLLKLKFSTQHISFRCSLHL